MRFRPVGFVLVALLLIAGLLSGCGGDDKKADDESTSGKALELALSPQHALAGDTQKVIGKAGPAGRPVALQKRDGDDWAEVSTASAGDKGAFEFEVTARNEAVVYRVLAPAGEVAGAKTRERISPDFEIVAAAATGTLEILPAIGQGKDGATELTAGVARFIPEQDGQKVEIEQSDGGSWRTVAAGKQDANGEFAFLLDLGEDQPQLRARSVYPDVEEPVVTEAVSESAYKRVWADEFEGGELGPDWTVLPTSAAAKRTCATVTPEMSTVADGELSLKVEKNPANPQPAAKCPDGQFLNSQIGTPNRPFTYGVFAARIKFQEARGMHSAFWFFPTGPDPEDVPETDLPGRKGSEIDVLEYYGDGLSDYDAYRSWVYWPKMVDGKIVNQRSGERPAISKIKGEEELSKDWHVVSVEWTSEGYIYRFDGVEFQRISQGISRRPQQLLLSVLTSDYEIPRMTKNSVPAVMKVDWVRAWQR